MKPTWRQASQKVPRTRTPSTGKRKRRRKKKKNVDPDSVAPDNVIAAVKNTTNANSSANNGNTNQNNFNASNTNAYTRNQYTRNQKKCNRLLVAVLAVMCLEITIILILSFGRERPTDANVDIPPILPEGELLSRMRSAGTIPTEIGLMTSLTFLDLHQHEFTGTFPTWEVHKLINETNLCINLCTEGINLCTED
mmetsp:Transcript_14126/g.29219  ORF Transcript_14126/g.29219 Transcript_14126/m.29219 type:complete len:195 (-) Transcript_14126:169-753(-)